MNYLPLDLMREVCTFLIHEHLNYCVYDDASRSLRICCKEFHTNLNKAFSQVQLGKSICLPILQACTQCTNFSDPFDRPLYRCAPFLWIEKWHTVARRCACHTRINGYLCWCPANRLEHAVCLNPDTLINMINEQSYLMPPDAVLTMIAYCRTFVTQIEESTKRMKKQNNFTKGLPLATLVFASHNKWLDFQDCMKNWGFHTERMTIRGYTDNLVRVTFFSA